MSVWTDEAIYAAWFARIASDAQGASVRALLGSPSSVVELGALQISKLPSRPLLVAKLLSVSQPTPTALREVNLGWFVYTEPSSSEGQSLALSTAITQAYPPRWLDFCFTTVAPLGPSTADRTLGLVARLATVTIRYRGTHALLPTA